MPHHQSVDAPSDAEAASFKINYIEYIEMIRGCLPESSACRNGITKTTKVRADESTIRSQNGCRTIINP